jgi:prevent-host-death family protein
MQRINVHEAKTHLSRYLERVGRGEVFTICRNNVPVAELRAVPTAMQRRGLRSLGLHKGQVQVAPTFFEPLDEDELQRWSGGER